MRVGNGERFPHLAEARPVVAQSLASPVETTEDDPPRLAPVAPESLRVPDHSVVVEVTGELAPKCRCQLFKWTTAVVPQSLFQAGWRCLELLLGRASFHGRLAPSRPCPIMPRSGATTPRSALKPEEGEAFAPLRVATTETQNAALLHCHA